MFSVIVNKLYWFESSRRSQRQVIGSVYLSKRNPKIPVVRPGNWVKKSSQTTSLTAFLFSRNHYF